MKPLYQVLADQQTAMIRAGSRWLPSSRYNPQCHRTTVPKINRELWRRGLIQFRKGRKAEVLTVQRSPLQQVVDDMVSSGLPTSEIEHQLLREVRRRATVTIQSKQVDLIERELGGQFPLGPYGFVVSDDPGIGDYHLPLTDFAVYKKQQNLVVPSLVGIITASSYYYLQASVGLGETSTYIHGGSPNNWKQIIRLCRLVICDSINYDSFNSFMAKVRQSDIDNSAVSRVLHIPYLQPEYIDRLKEKILDANQ
jgi:hypothetical protein